MPSQQLPLAFRWARLTAALLLAIAVAAPAFAGGPSIFAQLGEELGDPVRHRLLFHLNAASGNRTTELSADSAISNLPAGSLVLAFGRTSASERIVSDVELARLGPEAFIVRTAPLDGVTVLAARGNPGYERGGRPAPNRGTHYACYAALEELGFGFLHPLHPTVPAAIRWPSRTLDRVERPHWPNRALHLHTMHPTELCHVLNGWGPGGPRDAAGWEALLPEWHSFLEWAVANRHNLVQWLLLESRHWADFAISPERQRRLTKLVEIGRQWGLAIGVDAPIALEQQNGFRLITKAGDLADELRQMRERIDWLMQAGFDLLSTEVGFSEFTHPDDRRMLAWMNEMTRYVIDKFGKEATVKVHCSVGQVAKNFPDPETGKPLNFNFLPHFADPRLGVLVHTVQHYGLDDPAPTYGRRDFADIRQFLGSETGRRPVYWYPETAYWVSFDIDVPLFLPLYAERRLHDLRLIAADERAGRLGEGAAAGSRMEGQVVFSSGWEWGYWLNDVVAARAAWNPRMELSEPEALKQLLAEVLSPLGEPGRAMSQTIAKLAAAQHRLLIKGQAGSGQPPADVQRRNGQAYLQGFETWDDTAEWMVRLPGVPGVTTQPDRVGPVNARLSYARPAYSQLRPLLESMRREFGEAAVTLGEQAAQVVAPGRPLADDLAAAARMTALRARQVLGLYDSVAYHQLGDDAWRRDRLKDAQTALDEAALFVASRESHYRVDPDRIAGWRANPTVYPFGYLWTVRSLFYWWRDEGKVLKRPGSPCYLNILNPAEVALAEGTSSSLYQRLEKLVAVLGPLTGWAKDCLHPPTREPNPRALVRD